MGGFTINFNRAAEFAPLPVQEKTVRGLPNSIAGAVTLTLGTIFSRIVPLIWLMPPDAY